MNMNVDLDMFCVNDDVKFNSQSIRNNQIISGTKSRG